MNKEKILYIYGYDSNPQISSTMKIVKEVVEELGFELISYEYDQDDPDTSLTDFEIFINDNNIKYVIGHSLGGFMTLCLVGDIKKLVINPCLKPHLELPKIGKLSTESLYDYEYLENWLMNGNDSPLMHKDEPVLGLFGDHDELIDFYMTFRKYYPNAYRFNSAHRPTKESFTEDIKQKIKEFFS